MAMGRGWVEIANEALAYLGKDPIQSLQEEGGTAMMCRSLLPGAAESVLTERPWKEAAKDILLAPIADEMEQDEAGGTRIYTFQIPPDCVRLIEVHAPGWRRTGDKIRSPRAPLAVRYVSMPEQPAVLPPYLHAGKRVRQIPTLGSSLRIFFYRVWPVGEIPILKGNGFVLSHGKTGSLSLNFPGIYGSALCLMGYQNGIPIGITHPGQGDRIQNSEHQHQNAHNEENPFLAIIQSLESFHRDTCFPEKVSGLLSIYHIPGALSMRICIKCCAFRRSAL